MYYFFLNRGQIGFSLLGVSTVQGRALKQKTAKGSYVKGSELELKNFPLEATFCDLLAPMLKYIFLDLSMDRINTCIVQLATLKEMNDEYFRHSLSPAALFAQLPSTSSQLRKFRE